MKTKELNITVRLGQKLGHDGKSAYQSWLDTGGVGSEEDFVASLKGARGKSAYELWLQDGNAGSVSDFLNSLKGEGAEADEEDLTVVDNKLFLKNKMFGEGASGLGRVYLRKNISSGKNILTQSMIDTPHSRYIIQYDYDLNGETIVIPNDATLVFEGGSFRNGAIKGNRVIVESPSACFDKTLVVLPGTISGGILYLSWFKMDTWTTEEYTANHKNEDASVTDTNRTIVNRHLSYRLIVPQGIYPFDGEISLVEEYTLYGSTFSSGCSLNIQGVALSEYGDRFQRSGFVFPKSRGFYWNKGLGNAINNVHDMYFEARDNIFHLWGNFNVSDMTLRTPNGWTNGDFYNIEMVSWFGSGFYSPANYAVYVFYNKYQHVKGWFPSKGKGFWEGMCDMCNVYDNVTLLYMGLDGKTWEGDNFAVFVNQSAYITQGNFDRSEYILWYVGSTEDFQKRYENQGAFFHAFRCNFEGIKEAVVFTSGPYVSIGIELDGTALVWHPNAVTKPIFNVSRLRHFKLNTFYTVGVPENLMLKINSSFGGANVVDADVDLRVHFEGVADVFLPGRLKNGGEEDLSFLNLLGRTRPQRIKALQADFINAGVVFTEAQEVTDSIDLINSNGSLKSTNLIFKRSSHYILPYIANIVGVFTAKNFEGRLLNIVNDGALLTVVTNRGNLNLVRGMAINVLCHVGGFQVVDTSSKFLRNDNAHFPSVYEGDSVLSADATKQYIVTRRNCGILAVGGDMKRNMQYNSHVHGSGVYIQDCNGLNTATVSNKVYWCVKSGTTADLFPSFDDLSLGAEIDDGSVRWRFIGYMPEFVEFLIK